MVFDSPVYEPIKIDELTFQFTTESEDVYKCYFLSYASFFSDYPDIASDVYGFNVDLVSGPIKHKGIDRRISFTVVNIVADFLASQVNAVVYFASQCSSLRVRSIGWPRWCTVQEI